MLEGEAGPGDQFRGKGRPPTRQGSRGVSGEWGRVWVCRRLPGAHVRVAVRGLKRRALSIFLSVLLLAQSNSNKRKCPSTAAKPTI